VPLFICSLQKAQSECMAGAGSARFMRTWQTQGLSSFPSIWHFAFSQLVADWLAACFWLSAGEETSLTFGGCLKRCPKFFFGLTDIHPFSAIPLNLQLLDYGCVDERLTVNLAVVANKFALPRARS
jgi:hypothetical protein